MLVEKKGNLLGIITAVLLSILALPILAPHLTHGFHIVHIFLHTGGMLLAIFLVVISALATLRRKTKKMTITTAAFSLFVAAESVLLLEATWPGEFSSYYLSLTEFGHVLIITTLGLLSLAVFRND